MAKFIVVGDKCRYELESLDMRNALSCAEKELKYGYTGNTQVKEVSPKQYINRR